MGFGQWCKCNRCDFDFMSGHSHHSGSSKAICTACFSFFSLPTENIWGPRVGELIVLHRLLVTAEDRQDALRAYQANSVPTDAFIVIEKSDGVGVRYPMERVSCPDCLSHGTVAIDFDDGQTCPQCTVGMLDCGRIEY
ncbi:MAG: hypothetical protein ACOY82_11215 [Pseudomonadota bacterium]